MAWVRGNPSIAGPHLAGVELALATGGSSMWTNVLVILCTALPDHNMTPLTGFELTPAWWSATSVRIAWY